MLKGADILTQRVYEYCTKQGLLAPGMKVIAGVSGGADSVCLLRMLDEMKEELRLTIVCVHIEHGIRGEESRADRDFVRDLCRKLDIGLKIYEEDVPGLARERSLTLEEAGRYVRYEAFRKELEANDADVIAVAHHKDDQAETVLFNMIRGSGLKGMSGMAPVNGRVIRPLLILTREEIEGYLQRIGQDHRIDSTNEDPGYTRNAIRGGVIPKLREIADGAVDHIVQAAYEAREADDYIRSRAAEVYERAVGRQDNLFTVKIEELTKEPPIIQRYVLRSILTELYTSHKDLEALHVKSLAGLCSKQSGRYLDLPRGMAAKREGDRLLIGRREDISHDREMTDALLNIDGETFIGGYGTFSACVEDYDGAEPAPDSLYTKWFDYDKIISRVHIRNRISGDFLTIGSEENRKKLKKYLIDEKVPESMRDRVLLLADGDHILWVVGMRISEHYKIGRETKRVLKVTYKETADGR
ncbi:MAG: tRNA lysidine(34) synthetase TilS [Lachnospiraceae bacterium]|nr:tRNA lysidine(34) synthetase TilS [Lachnospiraceae bacterium]